jgi:hypothetical protein
MAIIPIIPKLRDDQLLNLFINATRILSARPDVEARRVILAIEHEWKRRLDRARAGKYLPQNPKIGMLGTLGYHVGAVQGAKTTIRRQILKHVLEGQLPMVGSPAYTDEWGSPNSQKRYLKLSRVLESFLRDKNNNERPNMEKAMLEWREDLEWLRHTYTSFTKLKSLVTWQEEIVAI